MNIVIAADYPQRAGSLQHAARFQQPFARKLVIGRKVLEFVPRVVDTIDAAVVGAQQLTAELKIVRRIRKNQVDRVGLQTRHLLTAVANEKAPAFISLVHFLMAHGRHHGAPRLRPSSL